MHLPGCCSHLIFSNSLSPYRSKAQVILGPSLDISPFDFLLIFKILGPPAQTPYTWLKLVVFAR